MVRWILPGVRVDRVDGRLAERDLGGWVDVGRPSAAARPRCGSCEEGGSIQAGLYALPSSPWPKSTICGEQPLPNSRGPRNECLLSSAGT